MDIDHTEVWVKLIGQFNAYNVLLVYGVAKLLGEQKTNILTALSNLDPVDGRFQFVRSADGITAIVDYAHTPDALQNVLGTIHELRTRNEQVITVVGCGGDRDALKRPIMAKIACEASDKVILTSDNPRSEDPESILSQMDAGVGPQHRRKVLKLSDRREAIKTACLLAKPGDILLIAGKGHEKYQEIKGVKHPFDDLQELKNALTSQ
jgi:UDP-N-acetylmuramoyl-L-alanyl-D-glutamate--2,6-diaminopimelate ligase